jgi:Leucine-rich repeat (LRR) protein
MIKSNQTYAIMNDNSQVEELYIQHEINLPFDVFCLVNLHTLKVNGTRFVSRFELDDASVSTGLSPLISRLNRLRVLSLVNTTASYIPHHALAALTNLTLLEIENCGLHEIPSTITTLANLQILRLPNNHLSTLPQNNG